MVIYCQPRAFNESKVDKELPKNRFSFLRRCLGQLTSRYSVGYEIWRLKPLEAQLLL